MKTNHIYQGDALSVLKTLPEKSINMCMTSPPYWALRDYGRETDTIWDGDPNCEHEFEVVVKKNPMDRGGKGQNDIGGINGKMGKYNAVDTKCEVGFCKKCGAWKGQLGLEPDFNLYIKHLCDIFDEVKRVLRDDGTLWVNISDTFVSQGTTRHKGYEDTKWKAKGKISYDGPSGLKVTLQEYQRAWLGALLDGEGCFQIHKQIRKNSVSSYQADISVGMIDKGMVEYAHQITGLGSLTLQKRGVWDWGVRGQQAGLLARIVYPYLKIKRKQAKLLVKLCKNSKKRKGNTIGRHIKPENLDFREELFILNKKLNQREDVDVSNIEEPQQILSSVKPKSLACIPFRFAIEMVNRGWILRNTIIWHKPSCMPSSARDRFTVDFEYLFFFSKKKKYYFEQQLEPLAESTLKDKRLDKGLVRHKSGKSNMPNSQYAISGMSANSKGRNKRTVWHISPKPFKESHFAVYPPELCETPIKAGCPKYVCKKCGKPKILKIKLGGKSSAELMKGKDKSHFKSEQGQKENIRAPREAFEREIISKEYKSQCNCNASFESGIVLDPFFGAGTTGLVALKQGKRFVGIELNPEYIEIAKRRLAPYLNQSKLDEVGNGK